MRVSEFDHRQAAERKTIFFSGSRPCLGSGRILLRKANHDVISQQIIYRLVRCAARSLSVPHPIRERGIHGRSGANETCASVARPRSRRALGTELTRETSTRSLHPALLHKPAGYCSTSHRYIDTMRVVVLMSLDRIGGTAIVISAKRYKSGFLRVLHLIRIRKSALAPCAVHSAPGKHKAHHLTAANRAEAQHAKSTLAHCTQ